MDFEIVNERGHWNVYLNGQFQCSCDSYQEAEGELKEMKETLEENKL